MRFREAKTIFKTTLPAVRYVQGVKVGVKQHICVKKAFSFRHTHKKQTVYAESKMMFLFVLSLDFC